MSVPLIEDYNEKLCHPAPIEKGGLRLSSQFSKHWNSSKPLVSIITVVYNAENCIEPTIKSVIEQTYENVEYIIIDGGSTDRTLSIIQKYEKYISYWLSEPDGGIYDAMNKGIALCRGTLVGIINAGDEYTDNAIAYVVNTHLQYPSSILAGNCKLILSNPARWVIESGSLDKLPYRTIPHPSLFVPLSVYQEHGLFDISFKIAGDYDFLCRCYSKLVPFTEIKKVLAIFGPRGVSSNYYLSEFESIKVRLRHIRHQSLSSPYSILLSLRSFFTITIHKILEYLQLWSLVEARRHGKII